MNREQMKSLKIKKKQHTNKKTPKQFLDGILAEVQSEKEKSP